MSLDTYSLCPGGTGKKIKFCCHDLLADLQQLDRMFQGEQYVAALELAGSLLAKHPDRACLLAIQTRLLRHLERFDEAFQVAETFLKHHPDNPIALSERAILTGAREGGVAGLRRLLEAIESSGDELVGRSLEAMAVIAQLLLMEGHVLAARPLLEILIRVDGSNEHALRLYRSMLADPSVPLLLAADFPELPVSEGPWRERFDAASHLVGRGRWLSAEPILAALSREFPGEPAIWRELAVVRGRLADEAGCAEAMQSLAATDIPLETAAEAEAAAIHLAGEGLGDVMPVEMAEYQVADADRLMEALASHAQVMAIQPEGGSLPRDETGVPPKGVFVILAEPRRREGADESAEEPNPLAWGEAEVLLYGRQTDREARLVLQGVCDANRSVIETVLGDFAESGLGEKTASIAVGQLATSERLIERHWRAAMLRGGGDGRDTQALFEAVIESWAQMPLPYFDGKSFAEVAGAEAWRVKALAALHFLGHWIERLDSRFDMAAVRERFDLPPAPPVELTEPAEQAVSRLFPAHLRRVDPAPLSFRALAVAFGRAQLCRQRLAAYRFAIELIARPTSTLSDEDRRARLAALSFLAVWEAGPKSFEYLKQAREEVEALRLPPSTVLILEAEVHAQSGSWMDFARVFNRLYTSHRHESGVAEALNGFIQRYGSVLEQLAAAMPRGPEGQQPPAAPAEETSKLWTPDSGTPSGEKPGLWVPGS